jgi:hypothetical protein
VTVQFGEGEDTVPQSGVAQQAVIAKSDSKSKRMLAIVLVVILAPASSCAAYWSAEGAHSNYR